MKRRRPGEPSILYKYYGPERLDFFSGFRVRYSQLAALNDPFEFLLELPPGALKNAARKLARSAANPLSFAGMALTQGFRILRDPAKAPPGTAPPVRWLVGGIFLVIGPILAVLVFPFARKALIAVAEAGAEDIEQNVLPDIRRGLVLIFSCSELWNSVPMWAHYGGCHAGFVVGIDPRIAFKHARSSGEGTYVKPRPVRYLKDLSDLGTGKDLVNDFLVSKLTDWSYEKEWRFILPADPKQASGYDAKGLQVVLVDIDPKSIREVIFGLNCPLGVVSSVKEALQTVGLEPQLFRVKRGRGYALERVDIADDAFAVLDAEVCEIPEFDERKFPTFAKAYVETMLRAKDHPVARLFTPRR